MLLYCRELCMVVTTICLVFLLGVFGQDNYYGQNLYCEPDSYRTTLDNGSSTLITWIGLHVMQDYTIVSSPVCLNRDNEIKIRECDENGVWEAPIQCNSIDHYCPENFYREADHCVNISGPATFQAGCPIPGNLFSYDLNGYWYPGMKLRKYDFNLYSSTIDSNFGNVVYYGHHGPDCAILSGYSLQETNCTELRNHSCIYKEDHFLHLCPDECVPAGLGSSQCYCKITNTSLPRQEFCENFASPNFLYQSSAIRDLAGKDTCWFKRDNTFAAVNSSGTYSFNVNHKLNCSICAVNSLKTPNASLTLQFNHKKHKLYLIVESPEGLYNLSESKPVLCFSDSYPLEKVETKKVFESSSSKKYRNLKQNVTVYELEVANNPMEYFCYGFQLPDLNRIKSNAILAYKKIKHHMYALHITATVDIFRRRLLKRQTESMILYDIEEKIRKRLNAIVSVKRILDYNNITKVAHILLHVTTTRNRNIYGDYYKAKGMLESIPDIQVIYFRSSEFCYPEETISENSTFHWEIKKIGETAVPQYICLQPDGLPVTRKCIGSFLFGAFWESVSGSCPKNYTISEVTETLQSYVSNNVTLDVDLLKNITTLSEKSFTSYDVYLLANLFESGVPENSTEDFLQTVRNVMKTTRDFLNTSQIVLNSTDKILDSVDTYLTRNSLSVAIENRGYFLMQKENMLLQITNPFVCNVSGLAAFGRSNDGFDRYSVINITRNDEMRNIGFADLQFATYIPNAVLNEIASNLTEDEKLKLQVIVTVFYNDSLFNSANFSQKVDGRVISVLLPQYEEVLEDPIPLYLNSTTRNTDCVFWDYGGDFVGESSKWSNVGENYFGLIENSSVVHCGFIHLTHFALLITTERMSVDNGDGFISYETEERHDYILTIITYVGCIMSLLGIIGIYVTGALFEKWRRKAGSKILLQISLAITIEIVITQLAGMSIWKTESSLTLCTIIGVILHYIVLSKFSWMLISAYLQYHRFVTVLGPMPSKIVLKTSLLGWVLPLVPVLSVFFFTPENYQAGSQNFCYPKSLSLYLGVFLPILLIITCNIIIFSLVMHNVTSSRVEGKRRNSGQRQQVYLGVLLFFLLGLPWMFGVLGEVVRTAWARLTFIYLFCFFATLQGFVLFVFYVLLDKETLGMYRSTFCNRKRETMRNMSSTEMVNSK